MSQADPAPRPGVPAGPPRWLLLMLSAGVSLLVATVVLLLLGLAGVDEISSVLFVVVLVVAALTGGSLVRVVAPRLPGIRRPPRA